MFSKNEDEIRDYLAEHLDLIEDGLVLINKEEYLPNDKGAAGFIDIFARAEDGKLVVIEIKRSDAAARQAIQELAKYAALLKSKKLIKETEYRLLVLSTDWHELLTPFSEFVHATSYDSAGRKIILTDDGLPASTEHVSILPPARTRKFSKRHFIFEFETEATARDAIQPVADYMKEAGLKDFILALLTLSGLVEGISHLLYFAQQELSFDEYMELIKRRFSAESLEEFEAYISDMSEPEDRIGEAADKVWDSDDGGVSLYMKVKRAGAQISHPEKANYWFASDRVSKIEIFRFGQFQDQFLSDETIIEELKGDQGGSNYRIDTSANVKSKPEMQNLLASSGNVFFFNPEWRSAVRDLCGYAEGTGATRVRLTAFSNDDILLTLAGLAIGDVTYAPGFRLEIEWQEETECYLGCIEWSGRKTRFKTIVQEHFDGDGFGYFTARHFGANRSINADLMNEFGLSYGVWKEDEADGVKIRVQGNSVIEVRRHQKRPVIDFINENERLLGDIVGLFLQHDHQFIMRYQAKADEMFAVAEAELETHAQTPTRKSLQWCGDLVNCDVCGTPFERAKFMVDAHLRQGGGACLCALCFFQHGIGLGWGKGQLYRRVGDKWLLVAGGPPKEEE